MMKPHPHYSYEVLTPQDNFDASFEVIQKPLQHILNGHDGVLFSCKAIQIGHDHFIASTSDDRTIRLWRNHSPQVRIDGALDHKYSNSTVVAVTTTAANDTNEKSNKIHDSYDKKTYNSYELLWTGYAHTARVWDCTFLTIHVDGNPRMCILTTGEDTTSHIWSMENGQVLGILKGHQCQSVWKASVNQIWDEESFKPPRPLAVTGGNDGTVKCWDILHHVTTSSFTKLGGSDDICFKRYPLSETGLSQ